jgi:cytochrome c oxidase subunit 2
MGPTLLNIYGAQRRVVDANGTREAFVDEAYLRRAIVEPDAELVEGFEGMPSYKEEMPEQDLDAIIKYLTGGAKRDLDRGRQLMEAEGCLSCHSTDGSEIAGPTLKNIVGREVEMADGSRMAADDQYLIEAILDPEKFIVVGYDPIMPSYEHLTEDELQAMLDYMHSLSEDND